MFLRKHFVTNFTFNESAGMNSAQKLQPYTSKSYITDQILNKNKLQRDHIILN